MNRKRLYRVRLLNQALAIQSCPIYIFRMTNKNAGDEGAAPGHSPLQLEEFLCFAIYSASHAFTRTYQPLLKGLGLTYPQFIVLILLWEQDNQTIGQLGERLYLQSNTLTPLLKRLAALRYIARVRDSADERQVRIQLTPAGRNLRMRASAIVRSVRVATGLKDDGVMQLTKQVEALRRRLDESRTH